MGRRVELWFSIKKRTLYLIAVLGGSFALLLLSSAAAHAGDGQPTAGDTTQSSTVTGTVDPASDEVLDPDDVDEQEAVEEEPAAQPGEAAGESGAASTADDAGSPAEASASASPASSVTGGERGGEPTRTGKTDADDEIGDDAEVSNVAGEPSEPPAEPSFALSDESPEPQEPPEPAKPLSGEVSGDAAGGAGHAETIDRSGDVVDVVDEKQDADREDEEQAEQQQEAVEEEPAAQPGEGAGESGAASRADDAGSPAEASASASPASSVTGGERGGEPTRTGKTDADDGIGDDAEVSNVAGEPRAPPAEPSFALSDESPEPQEPPEPAKPLSGEVSGDAAGGAGHAETIDRSGNGGQGDDESDPPAAVRSPSAATHFEGAPAAGDSVRAPRAGESSASDPAIGGVEPDVVPPALELATSEPWAGPNNELGSWPALHGLEAPTPPRAFTAASASSAAGVAWILTAPPKVDRGSGGASNADGEGFKLDRLLQIGQRWWSILGWLSHAPVDPIVAYSLLYGDGEVTPPSPGVWDTVTVVGRGGFWSPNVFCGLVSDRPAQLCDSPHMVPERPG